MMFTCARCGEDVDTATCGELSTTDRLEPATAAVAKRYRAEVLSFFGWTIDDAELARCSRCSSSRRTAEACPRN